MPSRPRWALSSRISLRIVPRWLVFYGCLWAVVIDSVPVSGSQGWLWPEDLLACVGFLGWHEPCWGFHQAGWPGLWVLGNPPPAQMGAITQLSPDPRVSPSTPNRARLTAAAR